MDNFAHAILMNAVLATGLAAAVAVVCRFIRQPSIVRALWLLVLLRLAAPPLIGLPVSAPMLTVETPLPTIAARRPVPLDDQSAVSRPESVPGQSSDDSPLQRPQVVTHHSTSQTPTSAVPFASSKWPSWHRLLLAFWIFGTVAWCAGTLVRVARFSRWLRQAKPAPTRLTARAREIAGQLGLRSCPELLVVSGRISPSLWGLGRRARILLPRDLLKSLKVNQHDMLLAHELSHYRRGDHWCRWFEVGLLAVYWWHPVAWLAQNRMLRAEEQCCDAWVLWTFPNRVRTYAETLLATIDFLSPSPSVVAPAATGVSVFPLLKRRLEMILHDRPRHRMTTLTNACLIGVASIVLGLSPVLLADKPAPEDPAEQAAVAVEQDAEALAPLEWEYDRELDSALHKALVDFREKQRVVQISRLRLLGVVAQLEGHRDESVELAHLVAAQSQALDKQAILVRENFNRVLAAQDEVNGRRAVWLAGVDKQLEGDTINLYLNSLQRLAEAQNEYFASVSDSIDVSELGEAVERQKQQWRARRRLDAAISGRDATLRAWQVVRARREENGQSATIQAESQARTQYFAFQAIVDLAQKEYLKGI